ncbi:hypothetical protein MRX96_009769 [Rhipicephalus microplus]
MSVPAFDLRGPLRRRVLLTDLLTPLERERKPEPQPFQSCCAARPLQEVGANIDQSPAAAGVKDVSEQPGPARAAERWSGKAPGIAVFPDDRFTAGATALSASALLASREIKRRADVKSPGVAKNIACPADLPICSVRVSGPRRTRGTPPFTRGRRSDNAQLTRAGRRPYLSRTAKLERRRNKRARSFEEAHAPFLGPFLIERQSTELHSPSAIKGRQASSTQFTRG